MDKYDLAQLVPMFDKLLDVTITVHDNTGVLRKWTRGAVADFYKHEHEYCRYRRFSDKSYDRNCMRECLTEMDKTERSEPFLHKCWKGAVEIVFPVRIENRRIMTLFAGVFRQPGTNCPPNLQHLWNDLPVLSPGLEKKITGVLRVFVDALTRQVELELDGRMSGGRKGKLLQFIELNFDKNIGLDDIARLFAVSPSRAGHVVKSLCGKSLKSMLIEVRIARICDLLKNTDYTIERIALMCGMGSSGYLHRIFTREMGLTPGQYRKSNQ